jgi:hypothetical protein
LIPPHAISFANLHFLDKEKSQFRPKAIHAPDSNTQPSPFLASGGMRFDAFPMASFTTRLPMIFRPRFLSLALCGALMTMFMTIAAVPTPAAAQAASEFAPLPMKPSKPKPARVAPAAPPARVTSPQAEAPATPAVTPPVAASAPAEPAPVSEPSVTAPVPAEPAPVTAAAPDAAPAEKIESKAEPEAKLVEPKAAEKEKDKKKKAAEKHEKQEKSHKQAKEQVREKDIPEPKPERVELKNANRLPPDDKGPRAIEFIGKCLDNYDKCMAYVNEQAQKIPNGEVCLQSAADQQEITEKVRKFITLRPAIHGQAANRMVTEALFVIYPCRRASERTAGRKK